MDSSKFVTLQGITFYPDRIEGYCSEGSNKVTQGTKVWFKSGKSIVFEMSTEEFAAFLFSS